MQSNRKLTLGRLGMEVGKAFGGQEANHPVAYEFQHLIVPDPVRGPAADAGMGQRPLKQVRIGEGVAKPRLQRGHGLMT